MTLVAVEVYVQGDGEADRQRLRVAPGAPLRAVLERVGHAALIGRIAAGELGLACFSRRAGLDDLVQAECRIEVLLPITADAKAWRRERVAARRAGKRSGGWNPGAR